MAVTENQNATDSAQPGSTEGASSGESELDALLKEYETDRTPEKPNGDTALLMKGLKPVIEYAQGRMVKDQADVVKGDLDDAYKFVTEQEELKTLKSSTVRGFLEAYSVDHPDFAKAFQNRAESPEQWKEALSKSRDWLKEEFTGMSQTSDRDDIEAAQAAVTDTTDEVPTGKGGKTAAEMFAMSGVEWQNYMDAELAKA